MAGYERGTQMLAERGDGSIISMEVDPTGAGQPVGDLSPPNQAGVDGAGVELNARSVDQATGVRAEPAGMAHERRPLPAVGDLHPPARPSPGADATPIDRERQLIRRARAASREHRRELDEVKNRATRQKRRVSEARADAVARLSAPLHRVGQRRAAARALVIQAGWGDWVDSAEPEPPVRHGPNPAARLERISREVDAHYAEVRRRFGHRAGGGRGPRRLDTVIPIAIFIGCVATTSVALTLRGMGRSTAVGLPGALVTGVVAFAVSLVILLLRVPRSNRARLEPYLALVTATTEAGAWYRAAIAEVEEQYRVEQGRVAGSSRLMQRRDADVHAQRIDRLRREFVALGMEVAAGSPRWSDPRWRSWSPVTAALSAAPFGTLRTEEAALPALPAVFPFPGQRALVVKVSAADRARGVALVQTLLLRLLAGTPPGGLRFTFVDPVGLGQSVAGFMGLADHDESLVTGKAWAEPHHIEQRLADLTEHMENVIQKYLRRQFATIDDYNREVGELAEPYRLLAVFDFPTNFSAEAVRRLVSIVRNGARCGVCTVLLVDAETPPPPGLSLDDLKDATTVIAWEGERFVWQDQDFGACRLELDDPAPDALQARIVDAVGAAARAAGSVAVPFARIVPEPVTWWRGDARHGITVPLGPSGARKVQRIELGVGTAQHTLVVGKTGSGKSTLLHTLITSLALTYSPEEVQLYLVDFKKGVEFKIYAELGLPHARVIAIESEREFGLSVLDGLDAELTRRGDLFRAAGVDRLPDYRERTERAMPRLLLVVDEFQEFFTEDDQIAAQAGQILDRLVRQGRAFGLHVLLGSQTLAGTYSLARSTIDQMAIRIALQCSEADSRLILADDNPAARLLSRPGEATYNAANGRVEGNDRFQVAWLPDAEHRAYLGMIAELAVRLGRESLSPAIVFEGNVPADVTANAPLASLLAGVPPVQAPARGGTPAWLGEPIALRGPVAAVFRRQSGSNLLIVGQYPEVARGMIAVGLIGLAAQAAAPDTQPGARYVVLDLGGGGEADSFDRLAGQTGLPIHVGRRHLLAPVIDALAAEVQRRLDGDQTDQPPIFLVVYGLQRARDLHPDDGFALSSFTGEPAADRLAERFGAILRTGPDVGVHTIAWCDTVTNLGRSLDRRALRAFGMRVAFQMGVEDSASLIDNSAASKLGPYRALFVSEDDGLLEKFRPYGRPSDGWLAHVGEALSARAVSTAGQPR